MYKINGECGYNLRDNIFQCTYTSVDGNDKTVSGSCNENIAKEGNYYSYSTVHSPTCYLSDAFHLEIPLRDYNVLMGYSGLFFGFFFSVIIIFLFGYMGRK
jgi:hypothetical protein